MLIIGAIVGVLALLGAGAFFFQVEYEEFDDEEPENQAAPAEDPYAWGKAKETPVAIPAQAQAQPAAPQPAAASTHPGWLWDEASNSWVPDPNYTPEQ